MRVKILVLGFICVFVLVSCALFKVGNVRSENQRAEYIAAHTDTLTDEVKEAISEGTLIVGMTADEVKAVIGKPQEVGRVRTDEGVQETWIMFASSSGNSYRFRIVHFDEEGRVTHWVE